MKHLFSFLLLILISLPVLAQQETGRGFWSVESTETGRLIQAEKYIFAKHFAFNRLDLQNLKELAQSFPDEQQIRAGLQQPFVIELPSPDGVFLRFQVAYSPIMEQELAVRYPMIKTYIGQGIDDKTASLRFDITPAGFHAQVLSADGSWYIDPYSLSTNGYYMSYYKRDIQIDPRRMAEAECVLIDDTGAAEEITFLREQFDWSRSGEQLRTYRTAIAATGEYTTFHGGTVASGLAAVVTALNRVSGIYEIEVAVRMILIGRNDTIIYTNSATDPYTNNNGSTMLTQNVNNLNAVIGAANFDVGHVFSTGGGGVAGLGVICGNSKARGVTGLTSPIGDPFYVDYVAHEMGHQFGGNHSFNGSAGSCSGGNRNGSTAYEPGSGTTIMAYAGICGSQNTQNFSDPYFHGINLDEIIAYTTNGNGNSCPVTTSTGNLAPVVIVPGGGFTIPKGTPFALTGSATDGDNDTLTYCWEQFDLGSAGAPNSPVGNAPIFRSFNPSSSTTRYFPRLTNVINNTQVLGEILPAYTRTLTFRLTARDNKAGGGGTGKASVQFSVSDAAGPFLVTFPNTAMSLDGSTTQTITWDVAGTNVAPVNTQFVNILLSTDGGLTFPQTIVAGTANDGAEQITLPNVPTTTARIKIEAVGNVYYDMSNANFTIVDNPVPVELVSFKAGTNGTSVVLEWTTATETNNSGFTIERSADNISFQRVAFVEGHGTSQEINAYIYTERIQGIGSLYYRLCQTDFDGSENVTKAVEVSIDAPADFVVEQNYPNPFNPSTTITFSLPVSAQVQLRLYDANGELVKEIANASFGTGYHSVALEASALASGIYTYVLTAAGDNGRSFSQVRKLVLLR